MAFADAQIRMYASQPKYGLLHMEWKVCHIFGLHASSIHGMTHVHRQQVYLLLTAAWLVLGSLACHTPHRPTDEWVIAYKNDPEGQRILGSKETLVQAVRSGKAIRIGWGVQGKEHTIEHVSEPIWLAILDGREVIAHLDPQVLSVINWDSLTAEYSDDPKLVEEWRVVITTHGTFDAVWQNRETFEVVKRRPQNHMMTWFIKDDIGISNARPLFSRE